MAYLNLHLGEQYLPILNKWVMDHFRMFWEAKRTFVILI